LSKWIENQVQDTSNLIEWRTSEGERRDVLKSDSRILKLTAAGKMAILRGVVFAVCTRSEATCTCIQEELEEEWLLLVEIKMRMPHDFDLDFKLCLWAENTELWNDYKG